MTFAFRNGPLLIPEIADLIVARFARFVRFTAADLTALIVPVARFIGGYLHRFGLAIGHICNGIATSGQSSNEARRQQREQVDVFHTNKTRTEN